MPKPDVIIADFADKAHADAIVDVLNAYATDVMGGGVALREEVKAVLVQEMAKVAGAVSFLAYVEGQAVGLCNCFPGFSTFSAKPLLNIHDICVKKEARGKGIGSALLSAVEEYATTHGYKKITLEVRADNPAQSLYERFGYKNNDGVEMRFLTKVL